MGRGQHLLRAVAGAVVFVVGASFILVGFVSDVDTLWAHRADVGAFLAAAREQALTVAASIGVCVTALSVYVYWSHRARIVSGATDERVREMTRDHWFLGAAAAVTAAAIVFLSPITGNTSARVVIAGLAAAAVAALGAATHVAVMDPDGRPFRRRVSQGAAAVAASVAAVLMVIGLAVAGGNPPPGPEPPVTTTTTTTTTPPTTVRDCPIEPGDGIIAASDKPKAGTFKNLALLTRSRAGCPTAAVEAELSGALIQPTDYGWYIVSPSGQSSFVTRSAMERLHHGPQFEQPPPPAILNLLPWGGYPELPFDCGPRTMIPIVDATGDVTAVVVEPDRQKPEGPAAAVLPDMYAAWKAAANTGTFKLPDADAYNKRRHLVQVFEGTEIAATAGRSPLRVRDLSELCRLAR